MTPDVECLVVGAGVVGLAIAKALAERGQDVLVLEQHSLIGSETSARNSEVIHAGLYYPPGSLKARFCVAGKQALYRFCEENGVATRRCGKILVALDSAETIKLTAIMENAERNGVCDLQALSQQEVKQLEPALHCKAACLSPSTGVLDTHGYLQALEGHLAAAGGQVVLNSRVLEANPDRDTAFTVKVETDGAVSDLTTRRLVNAAGHGATVLADTLCRRGDYRAPRTYAGKGHYFQLAGASPFRHFIYPMPQGAWLGLHLAFDVEGKVKLGPDLEWRDAVNYDFEDEDGAREATFYREVRRYWPALPDGALSPDYTGVRPKIYRQGEPAPDFAIHGPQDHGLENFVGLYGIESPGLTSSLAIGDYVADLLTSD